MFRPPPPPINPALIIAPALIAAQAIHREQEENQENANMATTQSAKIIKVREVILRGGGFFTRPTNDPTEWRDVSINASLIKMIVAHQWRPAVWVVEFINDEEIAVYDTPDEIKRKSEA